jgi:general secretion pathway protein A
MKSQELRHFGLSQAPLGKEIAAQDLFVPTAKGAVLDDLAEAIAQRDSALLVGDPGVGKTCILRALRQRLANTPVRLTYCHNATVGRRDFYRLLSLALGLATTSSAASLFSAVTQHVHDLANQNIHPVFVLDEAHLLHQDMIDHLHILMNYEWDSRALLSLVLLGLPELEDRLRLKRNRSLYSRLHHRLRIEPLTADDTAEYLRHRLALAGCDREVFTSDAILLIHEAADGSLRDIDRIATHGLSQAARAKKKLVEASHLVAALEART